MKPSYFFLIILAIFFFCCSDTDNVDSELGDETPIAESFSFSDGFEGVDGDFDALFPDDNSRWTKVQLVDSTSGENRINLTNEQAFEGDYSLSILSVGSDDILSKNDLEKGGLSLAEGQTVTIGAHFYLESEANIENLLLLDVECCSCWDPSVPDNQCPGIRLMLSNGDVGDYLFIERGKIGLETLEQGEVVFPRNEWVEVRWIMQLSSNENGTNQLFINGTLAIDEIGGNMPNERVFKDIFAAENIDFELQTPVIYERLQIGATANPTEHEIQLYVDDFLVEVSLD